MMELFIDHECIHTLETLISYGPDQCGGEDSDTWQEYKRLTDNFSMDLEAARFGCYAYFLQEAESLGIDGSKTFQHFADASGYWGSEMQTWEELERAADCAPGYEEMGKKYLKKLRNK
jgi:hypothetical protein